MLKITKGPWYQADSNRQYIMTKDCTSIAYLYDISDDAIDSNGALIAEAGTVANECGLTPRELLEDNEDLLMACINAKAFIASHCSVDAVEILSELTRIIHKAERKEETVEHHDAKENS